MGLVLKNVQRIKSGWRYRRRIPGALQEVVGAKEFTKALGSTETIAAKNYAKAEAEFVKLCERAIAKLSGAPQVPTTDSADTPLAKYEKLLSQLRGLRFDPYKAEFDPNDKLDEAEWHARSFAADQIVDSFPVDPKTGDAIGMPSNVLAVVRALNGEMPVRPDVTLSDALKTYLEVKELSPQNNRPEFQRAQRVVGHIEAVLGRNPRLRAINRVEAREVVKALRTGVGAKSAGTVHRYLNSIRAILNCAIREYSITDWVNPFIRIEERNQIQARESRHPFSAEQLAAARSQILDRASMDLQLIWRILEGTGCRLGEVTGLRVSDIRLSGDIPHINVEWHELRRIKNAVSRRLVPLVGDALDAAKEVLARAGSEVAAFPRYCGGRGLMQPPLPS
jgi:integrase